MIPRITDVEYTGPHFRMTVTARNDDEGTLFYGLEIPKMEFHNCTASEMRECLDELVDELCDMQSLTMNNAILLDREIDKMLTDAGVGAEGKDEGA